MTERLILLPGWGLSGELLQPLAEALNQSLEVAVRALPERVDADIDAWLDELDARLPDDCWLAGWSLGGMLATALAARRGSRCRGVISLASNASFVAHEAWPQAMAAQTFSAFRDGCERDGAATLKRFAMLCAQGAADARVLSRQLQQHGVSSGVAPLLAGLDVLAALDNRGALSRFSGPQLHLLGGADALVTATIVDALLELLPTGEVVVLEEGSHAFLVEQPVAVAQLMLDFIREASDA